MSLTPEVGHFAWENLGFGLLYVSLRAVIFYSLFEVLYRTLNKSKGICSDLPSKRQLREEKTANIKTNIAEVVIFSLFVCLFSSNGHEAGTTENVLSFIGCYLFFEVWFYASHRLMHTKRFKKAHKTHHVSVITTPLSALTMSLKEKIINDIGMLFVPALLSYFLPIGLYGVMAYNLFNFYINVMGHSNLELMPKRFVNSFAGGLFSTSTYHSIHHLKSRHNFGLFTTICDRVFGTFDPAYLDTYNAVRTSPQNRKALVTNRGLE